jgi:NAD(P)-dependent dehydrogenase (short-subunit alcohol dehydrogenase family)
MKIILVGASGDIGKVAHDEFVKRHTIITAGRSKGDVQLDFSDYSAVRDMYESVGHFDAVVSCGGDVTFAPLDEFTTASFAYGLRQKVMGQINLVLAGLDVIADGGSFTLTSGVLDRDPIPMGASAATANGALAGFVTAAAIELPRGIRLNAVSPGLLDVSVPRYGKWFPGHKPISSADLGRAYVKSVEGALTGQVMIVE